MPYSIDSVDCQLPFVTHGRKIRSQVQPISETGFPLFDGSGKRWVTVHDGSLHVIDGDAINSLIDSASSGLLSGKAKETLPNGARAVWGIPKSGAGYVADCGESFFIKTSKGSQTVAGNILNVVSLGDHGVAILTADGRVFVYISETGNLNGPLSLPSHASAVATFGDSSPMLLVSAGDRIVTFDHSGRPGSSCVLPVGDLGVSGKWAVQDMIATDKTSVVCLIVQAASGDGGLPDCWTAVFEFSAGINSVNMSLQGYSANDVFISELKYPCRGFLRWIPELNILLVSHSCADAVSLYHKEPSTGRFRCLIMPEGKQLACALDERSAEPTSVRGVFLVPPGAAEGETALINLALAQSDGLLAIHTLEYPKHWKMTQVASAVPMSVPSSGPSSGFAAAFFNQSGASGGVSAFGSFGLANAAAANAFGSFGGPQTAPVNAGSIAQGPGPAFGGLGAGAPSAPSTGGLFTSAQPSSVQASPFGAFGAGAASNAGGIFGAAAHAASATSGFGSLITAGQTGAGDTSVPAATGPAIFGTVSASSANLFGGFHASSSGSSPFGGFGASKDESKPSALGTTPVVLEKKAQQPATAFMKSPSAASPPDPFKLAKSMPIPAGFKFASNVPSKTATKAAEPDGSVPVPVPAPKSIPSYTEESASVTPTFAITSTSAVPSGLKLTPVNAEITESITVKPNLTVPQLLENWKEGNRNEREVAGDRELLRIFDVLEKELTELEKLNYVCSPGNLVGSFDTKSMEASMEKLKLPIGDRDMEGFRALEDECEELCITAKSLFFGDEAVIESDSSVIALRDKIAKVSLKIGHVVKKGELGRRDPSDWEILPSAEEPSPILLALGLEERHLREEPKLPLNRVIEPTKAATSGIFGKSPLLVDDLRADSASSVREYAPSLKDLLRKPAQVVIAPKPDISGLDSSWKILRRIESDAKRIAALEKIAKNLTLADQN